MVTVVNGATNPVPVTGLVAVTRQIEPVRVFNQQSVEPGNIAARFLDFYTVPAGKRLVVEHLSCSVALRPPDLLMCGIEEAIGNTSHSTAPAYTPPGSTASIVAVQTGQTVKVIFNAGENFNVVLHWNNATVGEPGAFAALSGYLEDVQ
jgi:hypothetical protein